MRIIGRLENEGSARTFSDYLYVQGIQNQIEPENDGTWAVWIHAEEEIEPAKNFLKTYQDNPNDPGFHQVASQASGKKAVEQEEREDAEKRFQRRQHVFRSYGPAPNGPLTLGLIGFTVLVYLLQIVANDNARVAELIDHLYISESLRTSGPLFPEVRSGQIWRLVTPIFLHHSIILHILFNLLWLKDLGSMIEARESTLRLGLLVLAIAVCSNSAQYVVSGPRFMGMSGVVYGLLGYIWIRGKFDPASGYFLHPSTVVMMLVWFLFCLTGILPIANTVHAVGLALGMLSGYLSAQRLG